MDTTQMDAQSLDRLRQGFKLLNRFMVLMWRLGLGPLLNVWPAVGGRFLVLRHFGRKSGKVYLTPVNFAEEDGDVYITAGFGSQADWYRNILANPEVEVWLADGWWAGVAHDVSNAPRRVDLLRQVVVASGLAGPFFGVDPHALDDAQFAAATHEYRLVRIRRTAARTGPGGPGDLNWAWQVATLALFLRLLGRRK